MSPFDLFDYSKMKARPSICLLLFAAGGGLGVTADMLGVGSFTVEPVLGLVSLPLPDPLILAGVFAAAALIVGALSKRQLDALIYGASLGQCQFLLPFFIGVCFMQSEDGFGIIWRCLCGLPLTLIFSAIGFRLGSLLRSRDK